MALYKKIIACSVCCFCFFCADVYADIFVTDDVGRQIVLEEPAKRIIALSPHITENLFSAGAGDKIIATVEYSNYPEEAKLIQRVGRFDTVSIEKILALNPDLVIVWGSGGGLKLVEKLESLDITVYVDEPSTLESIGRSIKNFSILAGTQIDGAVTVELFLDAINEYKQSNVSEKKLQVFYQLWGSPIQTVNGKHVISDAINLCGGENIFSQAKSIAPKVNIESVLSKNPDVIIGSGTDESRPAWLDAWSQWASLSAVHYSNIYNVPPDVIQRHTLRILDGVKMICESIKESRKKIKH